MVKQGLTFIFPSLPVSHLSCRATVPAAPQRETICKREHRDTSSSTNTESPSAVCDRGCPSKPQHSTLLHPINREHPVLSVSLYSLCFRQEVASNEVKPEINLQFIFAEIRLGSERWSCDEEAGLDLLFVF